MTCVARVPTAGVGGTLTTEALGGELGAGAVGVDHHHAGTVVPLQLKTSRAADQVHVACVVDLKSKLFESRLSVPWIYIELKENEKVHIIRFDQILLVLESNFEL